MALRLRKWSATDIPDQVGRTVVVTGGNTGIGFATVSALAAKQAHVILACRDVEKGTRAVEALKAEIPAGDIIVEPLDLARLSSVRQFAEVMTSRYACLDVLIHNAGVMTPPLSHTEEGFELQFGTNALGPFALTGHLMPLLGAAPRARVVSVTSLVHWLAQIDMDNLNAQKRYHRLGAYGQSKLATLVLAFELQRRLESAGATVQSICSHPGVTRSDLARHNKAVNLIMPVVAQPTKNGALSSLMAATAEEVSGGDYVGPGGFMTMRGAPRIQKAGRRSQDPELGAELWEVAERLTGVSYLSDGKAATAPKEAVSDEDGA